MCDSQSNFGDKRLLCQPDVSYVSAWTAGQQVVVILWDNFQFLEGYERDFFSRVQTPLEKPSPAGRMESTTGRTSFAIGPQRAQKPTSGILKG
jgi:hypothetical protein